MTKTFGIPAIWLVVALGWPLRAAAPAEPLFAALDALQAAPNCTWVIATEMTGAPFNVAPIRGRTDSEGWLVLEAELPGTVRRAAGRGRDRVVEAADGWRSGAEIEGLRAEERQVARDLGAVPTPVDELTGLLPILGGLRREADGSYFGAVPEDTAERLIRAIVSGRAPGGFVPELRAPFGNVRVWLRDGRLQRYVISAAATASLPFGTKEIKRVSTVEIREVGATRVDVPAEAKAKLGTHSSR